METPNEPKATNSKPQLVHRQGDVALVRVASLPPGAEREPIEGERIILAAGEVTGHHHAISVLDRPDLQVWSADKIRFLVVGDDTAELVHEEHTAQPVEPGTYEIRHQREYHPEEVRRVVD